MTTSIPKTSSRRNSPDWSLFPENDGQCITGFMVNDSAMSINLHYQEVSNQRTGQVLTFNVNTDYAYTGIRHDPTGTHLASLKSGIENLVHSSDMGCLAYMQGLTGYYNQLEFPYLNSLGSAGQIVSIESATLYLYPLARSYNEVSQLPNDIRLYITDENNVLEDYVYGSDGVTVQTGDLTIDEMYGKRDLLLLRPHRIHPQQLRHFGHQAAETADESDRRRKHHHLQRGHLHQRPRTRETMQIRRKIQNIQRAMKRHYRIPLLLCSLCTASLTAVAQNTTNLPTSMYGVGELSAGDGGRYAGMGNTGIALNRTGFLNTLNPAAITRMDTACFTFDVGVSASYARYSFLSEHSSNFTGNPNRISMGFRVLPRWYALVGAAPYSSVGYVIQTEEEIEGMPGNYTYSLFEGTGGLYRCYVTNAFALSRQLSVGINLGMIAGTVTQSETQESAVVKYESSKQVFYADFGIHYEWGATGQRKWAAGLVFAPSLPISHDNTLTYSNSSTSENLDKGYHSRTQYLPMHLGTGLSITTERWVLTADYNYLDWSRNSSSYTSMKYENQHKVNLERTLHYEATSGTFHRADGWNRFRQLLYQPERREDAVSGSQCRGQLPIRYSYLSLGATWRKQLNTRSNLMQESRFSLNLNLTFGERIFESKTKVIQGSGSPQITRILHRMIIICWIYICNALHI